MVIVARGTDPVQAGLIGEHLDDDPCAIRSRADAANLCDFGHGLPSYISSRPPYLHDVGVAQPDASVLDREGTSSSPQPVERWVLPATGQLGLFLGQRPRRCQNDPIGRQW